MNFSLLILGIAIVTAVPVSIMMMVSNAYYYELGFNDGVNYTKEKITPALNDLNLTLTQLNNILNMSFEFVII